jgi:hypothetical protein
MRFSSRASYFQGLNCKAARAHSAPPCYPLDSEFPHENSCDTGQSDGVMMANYYNESGGVSCIGTIAVTSPKRVLTLLQEDLCGLKAYLVWSSDDC